jgi:hypothetical protein
MSCAAAGAASVPAMQADNQVLRMLPFHHGRASAPACSIVG